jgi:MYXO-CTERM domain-containing protein
MNRRSPLALSVLFGLCGASGALGESEAQAHIALMSPTPRYGELKYGPCGRGGAMDVRTNNVTTFKPGETITLTWKETVPHPGHYRIAFDPDGQRFTDPSSFTDTAPRMYVLKDGIPDRTGTQTYTETVTLPNVECNNCTLQLMQMMTDKPPYGNGDDLYYQCADIVLRSPPDMATPPDLAAPADLGAPDLAVPSTGGMSTGCTAPGVAAPGGLGALAVLGLALMGLRRRKRSA